MFEIQAVTSPTATSRDDEATAGTMTTPTTPNGHDVTTNASTIASTFKMTAEDTSKSNEAHELHSFETNSYNNDCSSTTCDHLQCSKQSSSHIHKSVEQICPSRELSNNSLDLEEAIEATVDVLNHQQNDSISNIEVSHDSIHTDCASLSKKNTTCDGANDLINEQKQENNTIQYSNSSNRATGYCNAAQGACGTGDDELKKQRHNKTHWNSEQGTLDDRSPPPFKSRTNDSPVTVANGNQAVAGSTQGDSLASPSYELANSAPAPGHFTSMSSTPLIEPADEVVPGTSNCHGYNLEAALTNVQANVKLPSDAPACTEAELESNLHKSCDLNHGKSSSICTEGASCKVEAATSMNITSNDQSTKSTVSLELNLFNKLQDVFSKRLYPGDFGKVGESTCETTIGQPDGQRKETNSSPGASGTSVSSEQNRELATGSDATAASMENGSICASGTSWKSPNTSTTSHTLGEPVITMTLPVTSTTNADLTSILGLNNNETQVYSTSTCPTSTPFNGESSLTCDGDHGCSKDNSSPPHPPPSSSSVIQATRDSSSPCSSSSSTPSPSWTPSSLIANCNGSAADRVDHSCGEEKGDLGESKACKVANDEVTCYNLEQINKLPGEDILFTGQTLQGIIALTRYRLILLNNNANLDQCQSQPCTSVSAANGKAHNGLSSTYSNSGDPSHVQVNGHSEEKSSTDSDLDPFETSHPSQSKIVPVSNEPESKSNCSNGLTSVAWVKNGETSCSKIDLNHSSEVKNHSTNNGLNNRYNRISLPIGIIDCVEIRDGVALHFLTKLVKCYKCDFASSDAASSWLKKVTDAISYASKLDHLFCFHHWKSTVSVTSHTANGLTNGGLSNGSLSKSQLSCQKQVTPLSNGMETKECLPKESVDSVDGSTLPSVIPSVNCNNAIESEEKDSPFNSSLHVNASCLNNIDEDKVSLASSLSLISLGNLDCSTSNSTLRVSTTSLTSNHSTTSSTIASTTTTLNAPLSSSITATITTTTTTTTTSTNLPIATNTSCIMSTATSSSEAMGPSVNTSVNTLLTDPLVKKCPSSMLQLLLGTCIDRVSFEFNRMSFGTYPGAWRITEMNNTFAVMPTYPQYLIVPGSINDEELQAVSDFRAFKRIPTIVWRSQKNGCVIARSGQPEIGWFGWRSPKDEKMITEITSSSFAPVSFSSKKLLILDARSYAAAVANRAKGGGCECNEYYTVAEVQFMGLANIHSIRKSFQTIRYLCQYPTNDASAWTTVIDSSKWLHHIAGLIKSALVVVDAISVDERPVLVHCSDGWDRTPQIIALAEMLLDPFYRTFDGFQLLIQKEWIEFGHKFADRCGSAPANDDSNERCPVFLQWIDCVHQLIKQFPAEFEFNLQFLVELIIHVHSCLFGTFTCNNMNERSIYNVNERSHSFWTSINENKSYFLNSHYAPTDEILRPSCEVVEMIFWNEVYAKHSISFVD